MDLDIGRFEETIKKMMIEQEQRFRNVMKEELQTFYERISKMEQNIIENKNDIKNLEKEVNDVKASLAFNEDVFESKIGKLHERIDQIIQEKEEIEDKIRDQEDRGRRNNLRVDGLKEYDGENE